MIQHFFTPGLSINTFLVYDEVAKVGAVIDPTRNIEPYLAFADQEGITITDILETHVHADFLSGALELKQALDNAPVIHCSGLGGQNWTPAYADHVVNDRDEVVVGSVRLQAWHTPGHTPEHIMWLAFDDNRSPSAPEAAFTGDLLFVGSIGRPDLLGDESEKELAKQLYLSLFKVIHPLPDFVEVYPAHGAGSLCGKEISKRLSSTFGYEKRCNPGMAPQEYSKWFERLREGMPTQPQYFAKMKQMNMTGPKAHDHIEPPHMTIEQLKSLASDWIVDTRNPVAYASGHIKGSINIPFGPSFVSWAGGVLPYDKPLVVVADRREALAPALLAMRLVGLDDIAGVIALDQWSDADKKAALVSTPLIDVQTLYEDKDKYYILDVRTAKEWDEGHIDGAHLIELTKVPKMLHNIPADKPVAVICHSGNRASIAASLLMKERGMPAFNVKGGMQAWMNEKLPV